MHTTTLLSTLASLAMLVDAGRAPPSRTHRIQHHRSLANRDTSPAGYAKEIQALEITISKLYNATHIGTKVKTVRGKASNAKLRAELKELKVDQAKDHGLKKERLAAISSANKAKSTSSDRAKSSKSVVKSTSSPSKSLKKGLGYNAASLTNAFGDSIGWTYNWASTQDTSTGSLTAGVEYIPMLWGTDSTGWSEAATKGLAGGATSLLGFNEPDYQYQSNMSPSVAAQQWITHMEPFNKKATLISPAITNGGDPMGATWMKSFLKKCTDCHVHAVAAHWYDAATNVAYFKNYLTDLHTQTGKPIWLTEFMGSGSVSEQQAFLEEVIPWLESTSFIERYAAFGDFFGTFVDADGELTALGKTYMNTK